ncbi:NAD-dependent epimerase/dehydratase family protein [candidate division KSB1 bacterium]|nr:NAD-dependent epimerase/dehydratase family protein [candidate division KSB1 bacterium]RQW02045.1 MAG: NAD-dependent epimerase/dehydratase family protein [candidate division KSB1 bacterium]
MKIFVTGGTGFIGHYVVKRLKQTDHEVFCLVRPTSDSSDLQSMDVHLITGDVTDKSSLLNGMKGMDWVVHLANIYEFWLPDMRQLKKTNVDGTVNVMQSVLETGVSKVVHISTVGIFGDASPQPFNEDTPPGPNRPSEYARTKYEGERRCWELYEQEGLPLVVIYPGGVLGPGDKKASGQYIRMIATRKMPASVFDNSVLTWVHVEDVAEAIVQALLHENNIGEKYLIGKEHLSFREFNQLICQVAGVPMPKLAFPDWLVFFTAGLLTPLANLFKKPPMLGMSLDQTKTMKQGFVFDGSKAERELGIEYRPVKEAINV